MNKENEPLISIVVPVYDTERYVDRCLKSLLRQSWQHLEIIVVNDASPDNIDERIEPYRSDPRIHYVKNPTNQGLFRTRVIGAKLAHGDYLAFVDSDDYVSGDFYRTLVLEAEARHADITIGKTVWEENGRRFVYSYHDSCFSFSHLEGTQVQAAFFNQEMQCYSWHTIWNKLYRMSLWQRCLPEFASVNRHLIMTEDLYFSSVLFFQARSAACVPNDAYFYCLHRSASTDAAQLTLSGFQKHLSDIIFVFDRVDAYLLRNEASAAVRTSFRNGRVHYARMWKNLAMHRFSNEQAVALAAVDRLYPKADLAHVSDDYFFESVTADWNGGLEYLKDEILQAAEPYISFDIFDTLIQRPLYEPTDLFSLLDERFLKLTHDSLSFATLRREGEEEARAAYGKQYGYAEITLDEIYMFLGQHYGIPQDILKEMKRYECALEMQLCTVRRAGWELFSLAKQIGKRVILISDMYLDRKTIEKILAKNGIRGYDRLFLSSEERQLKKDGALFQAALQTLGIAPSDVLHIGDSWNSDIEGSRCAGIRSIFFPKAMEVFENRIQGCSTGRCASIDQTVTGGMVDAAAIRKNLGFRCMQGMLANWYFDNPYRTFLKGSDFNADPYGIGAYLLGMHLMGLVKWLDERMKEAHRELVFLARDGYLPFHAYQAYLQASKRTERIRYVQASRRMLMPWIVKDREQLYQLPVEPLAHTPRSLMMVLAFAAREMPEKEWQRVLSEHGFSADRPFSSRTEYEAFLQLFLETRYDAEKHRAAKRRVTAYYQTLPPDAVTFDLGYSGRIQAAISEAVGRPVDVCFLHEDGQSSARLSSYSGFHIDDFYACAPSISGVLREQLFSDTKGSCIALSERDGAVTPVFEAARHRYPDRYVITTLQKGAVEFVKRFTECFGDFGEVMAFSPLAVSLPLEGFLRYPSKADLHIVSASCVEDLVYGAQTELNLEEFAWKRLRALGWDPPEFPKKCEQDESGTEHAAMARLICGRPRVIRALVWLLTEPSYFLKQLQRRCK